MVPAKAEAARTSGSAEDVSSDLEWRTVRAFAEEERQGLMLAAKTRTAALLIILVWQVFDNPNTGLTYGYYLGVISILILLGVLQFVCARQRFHFDPLKYVFVSLDCAVLAIVLAVGNPFAAYDVPPSFAMNGSQFALFFLFLMQTAFSFRPRLVLWCGASIATARTGMLLWAINRPGAITNVDLPDLTPEALIVAFANPNYVHLGHWLIEILSCLLVAFGLAVAVQRSRGLVETRTAAERARSNLERYFSPNVVDRLSGSTGLLGSVRDQNVAVLFTDIVGFTKLCENESAANIVALLREYHDRLGQAVFDNGGTLDKYIGDGLMATFGTPEPGPADARNALRCAIDMVAALDKWNAERITVGEPVISVGIGVHYGPVVAGDIGNARRLEYGVIGDTVNTASRLEHLTRELNTPVVVSGSVLQAVEEGACGDTAIVEAFSPLGMRQLRGRDAGVQVWVLKDATLR